MVYELTRENIHNLPRNTRNDLLRRSSFPICLREEYWEHDPKCFNGGLDKAGAVAPDALAHIKQFQPFNAVFDPKMHALALLASLDNRDKHRQLVVTSTTILAFRGESAPGSYWFSPASPPRKRRTEPVYTVEKMEIEAKASLAVYLPDVWPSPGLPLWYPTLPKPLLIFMLLPGFMLPKVLLGSVIGIDSLLRTFLRG